MWAKCVQVLWSVRYWISPSASAIFGDLCQAECSNPRRWHWEANPLGHPWCQILWGYLSRLNASQWGDIYLQQRMEKTICYKTVFSFVSLSKRKIFKNKSKHNRKEVWRGSRCWLKMRMPKIHIKGGMLAPWISARKSPGGCIGTVSIQFIQTKTV